MHGKSACDSYQGDQSGGYRGASNGKTRLLWQVLEAVSQVCWGVDLVASTVVSILMLLVHAVSTCVCVLEASR